MRHVLLALFIGVCVGISSCAKTETEVVCEATCKPRNTRLILEVEEPTNLCVCWGRERVFVDEAKKLTSEHCQKACHNDVELFTRLAGVCWCGE